MIRVLELFAGIGACSKALERLGIKHEIVDAVEIDKYAIKSFNAIHGTNFEPQDITKWDKDIECDLIMHGSPCQDFSVAGKNAGGDEGSGTRSSLLYETLRIVERTRPKYVIWENVKNLISTKHIHNWENYCNRMNDLGYNNWCKVMNAKDYGVPQNRERVFTVSIRKDISDEPFEFPGRKPLTKVLKDIMDDSVDEKYYLNGDQVDNLVSSNYDQNKRFYDPTGLSPTISTMGGGQRQPKIIVDDSVKPCVRKNFEKEKEDIANSDKEIYQCKCEAGWQDNKVGIKVSPAVRSGNNSIYGLTINHRIRKLTPKECWRLMGFDDGDFEKAAKVNSNTQLYKQAGNSIVVNVLEAILKELLWKLM